MTLSERLSMAIGNLPFYCRPLAFLCAVLLCGLFCFHMHLVLFIIYAVALITYAIFLIFKHGRKFKINPLPYLLITALLFSLLLSLPSAISYHVLSSVSDEHEVKGTVTDVYYQENFGSMYFIELKEIDGKRVSGNAQLELSYASELKPYDVVTVNGNVSDARIELSGSDMLLAKSQNLFLSISADDVIKVENTSKFNPEYQLYLTRSFIKDKLYEVLPQNVAGYSSALLLGEKDGVSSSLRVGMSSLGVSHVLAVSGMHLSIIAALITFIAERFKSARKTKSVLIIIGSAVFCAIAGFSPSVIRAAVMLTVSMLAVFFGSKSDLLTSLFLSGAIICVLNPQNIISCGFLLSFFATLGIVLCGIYFQKRAAFYTYSSKVGDMKLPFKIARKVLFPIVITVCAVLFTVPVMSLYFGEVSLFSVIYNPIAIPMAFVSMVLTLLVLVFGKIPLIGAAIVKAYTYLYSGFEWLTLECADKFHTSVSIKYPFFIPILILMVAVLIFLALCKIRNPLSVIAAFAVCAIIFFSGVQIYKGAMSSRSEITYMSGKTSEGFLVSSSNSSLYVDVGNGSRSMSSDAILRLKENYYETELDFYMLTHYHTDHIGTLSKLFKEIKINSLYLPTPQNENEQSTLDAILKISSRQNVIFYERGESITVGNVSVHTVPYCKVERSDHPIIALAFSSEDKYITYLGASVSESAINYLAEKHIALSSAIICGRHGPVTKENNKFLSYVSDKTVYLSPYEDIEESAVFENGSFVFLTPEASNYAVAVFDIS